MTTGHRPGLMFEANAGALSAQRKIFVTRRVIGARPAPAAAACLSTHAWLGARLPPWISGREPRRPEDLSFFGRQAKARGKRRQASRQLPPPREAVLNVEFHALATAWKRDTDGMSSPTLRAAHPAYQQIIGLGPAALPLILRELEESGGAWFWALRAISREDPVPAADRGKPRAMRRSWLRWGREKGLI